MLLEPAYLHGKPKSTGLIKANPQDFCVFEQLPFLPCGEGEHLFIHIKKIGTNTVFVARELAKYFKVKEQLVSYAGLKDRFAVTQQWFGVHVPGKQVYDLADLAIEGVEILSYKRHNKKLRTGALTGNRFELVIRNVTHLKELFERWEKIIAHGVPNYFGEQRFGIDGGNLDCALALFSGTKVKDKKKRGMYLSAARSAIFNDMINERIKQNSFDKLSIGDVVMLAGTQSVFRLEEIDDVIKQRLIDKDIDITAAMWGAGDLMTEAQPKIFEQEVAEKYHEFAQGLPRFGLKQERRRIRLIINDADLEILPKEATSNNISENRDLPDVKVCFSLAAGSYATTVLRELIDYQDGTQRTNVSEMQNQVKI